MSTLAAPSAGRLVLRTSTRPQRGPKRATGRRRWLGFAALAALAATLFLAVGNPLSPTGTTTPPAAGLISINLCTDEGKPGSPPGPYAWPGSVPVPFVAAGQQIFEPTFNSGNPTAYEWWGTAGMVWNSNNYENLGYDCGIGGSITHAAAMTVANIAFGFVATLAQIGLWIFSFLMGMDAFNVFIEPVAAAITALSQGLYANYLAPILLLSTLWMAWKGLVKKQSREAVTGAFWMIAATTAAAIFFTNPAGLMKGFNAVTQTITDSIIAAAATIGGKAGGDDVNSGMPDNAKEAAGLDKPNAGFRLDQNSTSLCKADGDNAAVRTSQCVMWYTFLFQPWSAGQFGQAAGQTMPPVEVEADGETFVFGLSKPGLQNQSQNPVPLMYLDSTVLNQGEVRAANPNLDPDAGASTWSVEASGAAARQAQYLGVLAHMMCSDDITDLKQKTLYEDRRLTDEGRDCAAVVGHPAFSGQDGNTKLSTAIVALVAIVAGMLPLVFLAGSLIVLQIAGVLLYLVAPVFLLLGVHPGFGRRMALGWVEMLLANALKRVGTAALISGLLILIGAVSGTSGGWFAQVVMIAAASIALMTFRKQFLQKISKVPLGGDGGGGLDSIGQGWKQKPKKAGARAVGGTAASTAAGLGGAGVGGIVMAGAAGTMMGRAATPLVTARTGWNTGQQKANEAQRRKQEKQQAAKGADAAPAGADTGQAAEGAGQAAAGAAGQAAAGAGQAAAGAAGQVPTETDFDTYDTDLFARQAALSEGKTAAPGDGTNPYSGGAVNIDNVEPSKDLLGYYKQSVYNRLAAGHTGIVIPDPGRVGARASAGFAAVAMDAADDYGRAKGDGTTWQDYWYSQPEADGSFTEIPAEEMEAARHYTPPEPAPARAGQAGELGGFGDMYAGDSIVNLGKLFTRNKGKGGVPQRPGSGGGAPDGSRQAQGGAILDNWQPPQAGAHRGGMGAGNTPPPGSPIPDTALPPVADAGEGRSIPAGGGDSRPAPPGGV